MAVPFASGELWAVVQSLLSRPKGGRLPVPDRAALAAILFVLKIGISWDMLPAEMGCGSEMTCWRRMRDWQHGKHLGGPTPRPARSPGPRQCHRLEPRGAGQDKHSGKKGVKRPSSARRGRESVNPMDRGRPGTKRYILTDVSCIPLALTLSPANSHDIQHLKRVIEAVPSPRQCSGRPRRRPEGDGGIIERHADKAYDFARCRTACQRQRILPHIARRGIDSSAHLAG